MWIVHKHQLKDRLKKNKSQLYIVYKTFKYKDTNGVKAKGCRKLYYVNTDQK